MKKRTKLFCCFFGNAEQKFENSFVIACFGDPKLAIDTILSPFGAFPQTNLLQSYWSFDTDFGFYLNLSCLKLKIMIRKGQKNISNLFTILALTQFKSKEIIQVHTFFHSKWYHKL